eukprot:COSAG01_NODE_160_length_23692_cov_9.703599_33_plen_74_part_00
MIACRSRYDADARPSTPCDRCDPGSFSNYSAVECDQCAAGQSDEDHSATTPCVQCQPGDYTEPGMVGVDCRPC